MSSDGMDSVFSGNDEARPWVQSVVGRGEGVLYCPCLLLLKCHFNFLPACKFYEVPLSP